MPGTLGRIQSLVGQDSKLGAKTAMIVRAVMAFLNALHRTWVVRSAVLGRMQFRVCRRSALIHSAMATL